MHSISDSEDRLLDRLEAAAYLGVSPGTLAVWATTGRYGLPYSKIGARVKYRLSDLRDFVTSRMVSPGVEDDHD